MTSDTEETVAEGETARAYPMRHLVVDVTAVSGQTIFTGVQRVLREFVGANRKELLLVKFDPRAGVFRVVPRLSRLQYRSTSGWLAKVRLFLKGFYWSASREFREEGSRRNWVPMPIRTFARWLYDSLLSDTYIERRERLRTRPVWHPEEGQTFLLIDIPVNRAHTEDLHRLSELDDVEFVVFLHDLFPLSHKHLFTPAHHPGVRARHLRYLDVVGGADVVVCNSRFTEGQYRKFVELLEEAPEQVVRTLYLPWPESDPTTVIPASRGKGLNVLTVGGLNQRKNIVTLVRAMRLLIGRGVDARLVVAAGNSAVSDPSLRAEMLDLNAEERARIEVIATTVTNEQLISLYDAASVVAVPSLAEGFGLPVVESLARRRPVVASNTTAITELAGVLPITLVDPTDAEVWSTALEQAASQDFPDIETPPEFPTDWVDFRRRLLPDL